MSDLCISSSLIQLNFFWKADSALKAAQTALQALEQQICIRRKKNDWQMEKLEKHLSVCLILVFEDYSIDNNPPTSPFKKNAGSSRSLERASEWPETYFGKIAQFVSPIQQVNCWFKSKSRENWVKPITHRFIFLTRKFKWLL